MKCKDCTINSCQYRTTDAEKECVYSESNIIQSDRVSDYWNALRNQAAIAAMRALIIKESHTLAPNVIANGAVAFADVLVEVLRKKEQ